MTLVEFPRYVVCTDDNVIEAMLTMRTLQRGLYLMSPCSVFQHSPQVMCDAHGPGGCPIDPDVPYEELP